MDYSTNIRRTLASFLLFVSVALWFLYLYFKLWSFIKAAIAMNYLNVQTVSFIVYSFALILFPSAIIYSPNHSKKNLFRFVCLLLSSSLLVGVVGDMITYNFFIDYTFMEGDAIFSNIVISIPNMYGVLCCLIIALAYAIIGFNIKERRILSTLMYALIVLMVIIPPFLYSFISWNGYPRQTWVEKAAFIVPHQICLLFSIILSCSSELIWDENMT